MLQRKQSVWLLLAALLNAGVFFFDLYRADGGVELRVTNHFPTLLIALVMVMLPLITIFMYKDRKRQIRMSAMTVLSVSSFVSLMLVRVAELNKQVPAPVNGNYWIGGILPVVALIFVIMAILGIRSDDKLVKSTDRLR